MERNRKNLKERGITLVALIITIIVMLILVAVTVRVVVESDIIGVAEKAAESKETGELKDQIAMKIGEWQVDRYTKEPQHDQLIGYLGELEEEIEGVTVAGTSKIGVITKGDTTITVNEAGEMTIGQADTWNGSREIPSIEDGNWYIYSAEQFKFLADYVNGDSTLTDEEKNAVTAIEEDTKIYLMADIDLGAREGEGTTVAEKWETDANKAKNWTPIGIDNDTHKFIGVFEGNGHVIRGAYVYVEGRYGGIFGNTTNKIQNLIVKDSYIKSTEMVTGGIIGAARAGEILNCHNINTNVIGEHKNIGGIVGQTQATIVADCSNSGNIHSKGLSDGTSVVGGIAGIALSTVQNCSNLGTITGNGQATGGIVGLLEVDQVIKDCSNSGFVQGLDKKTGGICGELVKNTQIIRCKNMKDISGPQYVGGIAGSTLGTIEKCYNKGDITVIDGNITETAAYLGGIAGVIIPKYGATIQNTYNNGNLIIDTSNVSGLPGGIVGGITNNTVSTTVNINNNYNSVIGLVAIGSINAANTVTVNASRNYYLVEELPENYTKTYETPKTETEMKAKQFVTDLNTGLQEAAWVKTSEYPALIGM